LSLAAIDADIPLYRAMSLAEQEINWHDNVWTLYADIDEAQKIFANQIEKIKDKLKTDDILCCLSDRGDNFRKRIDPSYKSNRKSTRKPCGFNAMIDWVESEYPHMRKPSLEADDVLGIIATKPDNAGKVIVVSDDKDLKTIPCKLYRPMADELMEIKPAQADAYFYTQTLTGDPTDGYSGCKGVGAKTAQKILGNRPAWSSVEQAFIKAGMTKQEALTQARLARILRWEDWDETKGEPKLWQP